MSNPSCIFYAATNGGLRRHALRLEAEGTIELGQVTAEPSELIAAVGADTPDLVIADLGDDAERVLDMLDKLPTPRPRLIVIGPKDQSGTILRAMRMGVRD
jgi:DNA-binding NarL/FixJ family response regulator